MRTLLDSAKGPILAVFRARGDQVYTRKELAEMLRDIRSRWRLRKDMSLSEFLEWLVTEGGLQHQEMRSADPYKEIVNRYVWGNVSTLRLATALRSNSYLCHGTAVALHGLGDRDQKNIYLNYEQSEKPEGSPPTQDGITLAFSRPQRTSKLNFLVRDTRVVIINGKHTNRLGVENIADPDGNAVACTGLERTLVDIVVRPGYAGGIRRVAGAYKAAMKRVDVDRLSAILKQMEFVYPYHQAVGYLMHHAGYPASAYEKLRHAPIRLDFYLEHNLDNPAYNEYWRIHVPQELAIQN